MLFISQHNSTRVDHNVASVEFVGVVRLSSVWKDLTCIALRLSIAAPAIVTAGQTRKVHFVDSRRCRVDVRLSCCSYAVCDE